MQTKTRNRFALSLFLIAAATPAYADAGVPMIFITLPGMLVALIPIIAIEGVILKKALHLTGKRAALASSVANVLSTVVGIPVTWVLLVVLQMVTGGGYAYGLETPLRRFLAVTWQAPWLIPYEADLNWMIPAALLVLLIPFFLASWVIEWYAINNWFFYGREGKMVRRATFKANVVSYLLLAVVVAVTAMA